AGAASPPALRPCPSPCPTPSSCLPRFLSKEPRDLRIRHLRPLLVRVVARLLDDQHLLGLHELLEPLGVRDRDRAILAAPDEERLLPEAPELGDALLDAAEVDVAHDPERRGR